MASRAGRLKERGKRRKHGSPEGEGGTAKDNVSPSVLGGSK